MSERQLDGEQAAPKWKTALWVLLYSFLCGGLLCVFSVGEQLGLLKFAFSLGALFLGIKFFRTYEKISTRIVFIGLSLVFYFILVVIVTIIGISQGTIPLPPEL